jgi:protein involved in polysaccharide export with SLBB domain
LRKFIPVLLIVLTASAWLNAPARGASPGYATSLDDRPRMSDAMPPVPLDRALDPGTYRLGPGDQLALSAGGISDWNVLVTVGPEGTVRVPNLGVRRVAGRTLEEVRRDLSAALQQYFPHAPVQVALARPRSFKVVVAGDVARPGTVTLGGPGRVFDAVSLAGGFLGGARRNVALRREGAERALDLVAFERLGDVEQNPLLQDGDVVVVRAPRGYVQILGGVNYPGEYEQRPGETLGRLVEVAGGYVPGADTTALRLLRFKDAEHADTLTLGAPEAGATVLRNGDHIYVARNSDFHRTSEVQVSGQVLRPGIYPIEEGKSRLTELLALAGGLRASADTARLTLLRPTENPPQDTAYVSYLIRGMELKGFDREYAKMRARTRAQVSMEFSRALRSPGSEADPVLRGGDQILVPERATSVLVQGEVLRPGLVPWESAGDARDFVSRAGGFTGEADRGHLWVTLGSTRQMVPAGDAPPLRPGDVVWVPAREKGSFWNSFKEVMLLAVQISTLYLVVHDATK